MRRWSRRQFMRRSVSAGAVLFPFVSRRAGAASAVRLGSAAMFVGDSTLPGETRADRVFPAHPNGLQVGRRRWLILYATRGLRGTDDDRSIVWQLRRAAPDGPVIREGFLSRAVDDWEPLGNGRKFFKQHGHPVAFGVPQGALIGGQPAPHANLFVAKWRTRAVRIDPVTGRLVHDENSRVGQGVEWTQFRLNERADAIEILQPPALMRQKGYESGDAFCSAERPGWMNQTYVQAVPLNRDATEWVDCNHFAGDRVAPLRYRFNAATGRYEWVETGPYLFDPAGGVWEASVARWKDGFIVAVRLTGTTKTRPGKGGGLRGDEGVGWLRGNDLFQPRGAQIVYAHSPACQRPRTAYACGDGRLRLFAGEAKSSPTRNPRDPICGWDVDPDDGFRAANRQVIFDCQAAALPMRKETRPMVDFCKALPPHGRSQIILHRVTSYPESYPPTPEEFGWFGIYAARLEFDGAAPSAWDFGPSDI
jgi:hypothetical protein